MVHDLVALVVAALDEKMCLVEFCMVHDLRGYDVEHCELADHAGHVDDLDLDHLLGVGRLLDVVCLLFLLIEMIAAPCQRRVSSRANEGPSHVLTLAQTNSKWHQTNNPCARAHQTKAVETCASPLAKRKLTIMPSRLLFQSTQFILTYYKLTYYKQLINNQ